jgi:hypothetical protein
MADAYLDELERVTCSANLLSETSRAFAGRHGGCAECARPRVA